jgi:hypothetical protein
VAVNAVLAEGYGWTVTDQRALSVYLNDHLAAATGGLELFRRVAGSHPDTRREEIVRLRDESESDLASLRSVMRRLGVAESRPMVALGWLGEKAGRLKPNGHLIRRSPLADVIELEGLRNGVHAKLCSWQVVRAVAVHDPRVPVEELDTLIERAEDQMSRLSTLHLGAVQENLVATG